MDTICHPTDDSGHPFGYLDQAAIEHSGDEDTLRMVREYDPSWEFVTTLFKPHDRVSSCRLEIALREPRENLGNRIESGQQQEPPTEPTLEPPDLETLMEWEAEGGCEATDGCWVESDGMCSHGHRSWLLELGLI